MFDYNESLVEGTAVVGTYMTTSLTANMTAGMATGGIHMGSFKRIVFDIANWAAGATDATARFAIQGATTAGATYYTITGPDTTFPSLVTGSFTAGGTITTAMTTVLNFARLEYKAESIRSAIDTYNLGTTAGGTKAGSWIRLALNPLGGVSGTGTFALTVVGYGVAKTGPSSDINVNKWLTNTSVAVSSAKTFIDGWALTNTSAFPSPVLPY